MRPILTIAKTELRTLVYSPIAWVVFLIFIIQCGVELLDLMTLYERPWRLSIPFSSLTDDLFVGSSLPGLFTQVQSYLYLYIPLLTMGLLSREYSSGSIKLLQASPVTVGQIVGGKFLAMMGLCLALVGVLVLFIVAGAVSITGIEIGMLLTGLLGLYLLMCTYAAIGLFISSLTSYQPVAAISTLVVLAALNYVGQVGQGIDLVRNLTYFLSISGRAESFLSGLISSKNVFYFALVSLMFLAFTWLKLRFERESKPVYMKAARYAAVVVVVLVIGSVVSHPMVSVYVDSTSNDRRTIAQESQDVVKQLTDGPLTITAYVNVLDQMAPAGVPSRRNRNLRLFERYLRFKPDTRIQYVYYWDTSKNEGLRERHPGLSDEELARKLVKDWNLKFESLLTPAEIRDVIDLTPEENRFVWHFEYEGRTSFVRMFDDGGVFPDEREITAGLKRLISGPVKVGFVQDHGERRIDRSDDRHYDQIATMLTSRSALINQGFDVVKLSLANEAIPANIDILVVADPARAYSRAEQQRILDYVNRGGSLMIAGEPGRQALTAPLLEPFGTTLTDGKLLKPSENFTADFILAKMTDQAAEGSGGENSFYPETWDGAEVSMPEVAGLINDGARRAGYRELRVLESAAGLNSADAADGERTFATATALSRTIGDVAQRTLVVGDADFMSNAELNRRNVQVRNLGFTWMAFKWLSGGKYPIDVSRPESRDTAFKIGVDGIFTLRVILLGVLPGLLLLLGSGLLIMRRRK